MESNALERSMKAAETNLFESMSPLMCSVEYNKTTFVENLYRKPNCEGLERLCFFLETMYLFLQNIFKDLRRCTSNRNRSVIVGVFWVTFFQTRGYMSSFQMLGKNSFIEESVDKEAERFGEDIRTVFQSTCRDVGQTHRIPYDELL